MKTQNILPVFLLLFLVSSVQGWSQKRAEKYATEIKVSLPTSPDAADDIEFTLVVEGTRLLSASGNFLKTYKFRMPDDIMEQVYFGPWANIPLDIRFKSPEFDYEVFVGAGYLNKAGILNVTVHRNGAGKLFPRGWF